MRKLFPFIFLMTISCYSFSQSYNPKYDSAMAKTFGADDYGMKQYILVILKTGPITIENKTVRDSLFAGHMANIKRLAELKKLIVAGPISKNEKTYRGIFILNVTTVEEATALLQSDPTITSKIFDVELYNWYGSAALPAYLESSEKVGKFIIE